MSNEFSYKSYSGSCVTSIEDECLHGQILFIDDLITYEGNTVPELKASFESAVDRYMDYCARTQKPANKPYSGTFNVRVGPNLHREAAQRAKRSDMTLNEFVRKALQKEVNQSNKPDVILHEMTINHVVKKTEQITEPFYSEEDASWQPSQEKSKLRVVQRN